MDNINNKHDLNIFATTFEPRQGTENQPEENFRQAESDHRSSSVGATQSLKSNDNGFMPFYMHNAQSNEFMAQLQNLSLSAPYDLSPYVYFQSLPGGVLSNSSFQSPHMNTRLAPTVRSTTMTGTQQQNQFNYPFINNFRMNQPPLMTMPYIMQPPVPNITNMTNAAGRSRRNSCMVIKVFNTGDSEIDKHLTELYKTINPRSDFNRDMSNSRFFVIKSYTEEHVHRSIKYGEWCSTQRGNDILDKAYRSVQSQDGHVFLFFSVNSSGYFCGVAEMMSECDTNRRSSHWNDDKWQGGFIVEWLYVKDVPNKYLKHIILEYNDNRPITNSRDATEIKPAQKGYETLRLIHEYHHNSSLFDDFEFYESRERDCLNNVQTVNQPQ